MEQFNTIQERVMVSHVLTHSTPMPLKSYVDSLDLATVNHCAVLQWVLLIFHSHYLMLAVLEMKQISENVRPTVTTRLAHREPMPLCTVPISSLASRVGNIK